MSEITYVNTSKFLTSISVCELLAGKTEGWVGLVTSAGIAPNFVEKYTVKLDVTYCDYIQQHSDYVCVRVETERGYVTVLFERKN